MKYTDLEAKVLSIFFTNIDKDVYCATDAMPNQLWATLIGGYSRSDISLRDRFLKIFNEVSDKDNTYINALKDLSKSSSNNEAMNKVLAKATAFMAKWSVEYGHNSLKDSSSDKIAIENVSIRSTKEFENTKMGAFQEKSTRYMDFSVDNFYVPNLDKLPESLRVKANESLKKSMVLYREYLSHVTEYYKTAIPVEEFKTEAAWIRTCKAKAFDEVRYLLPTAIKTSLGVTIPTRETERWISKLLASPYEEVVEVAKQLKVECAKINPALINHVQANPYLSPINSTLAEELNSLYVDDTYEGDPVILKVVPDNIEELVTYRALKETGANTATIVKWLESKSQEIDALEDFFEQLLGSRSKFDEVPNSLEVGDFTFEILVDIGAYRDLQRHRVGSQSTSNWSAEYGYSIPDVLGIDILEDSRKKYVEHMDEVTILVKEIRKYDRFISEYFVTLSFNVLWNYTTNLKQLIYLIELRSGESGHYSYRKIAQDMYNKLEVHIPKIKKYVRVNMNGYSDRRKAEEAIQEKIKKALAS